MNNIEQLIGKALDTIVPYTWHQLDHVEVEKVMREFAELIVRECAEQISEGPFYAGAAAKYIKELFGVEE